MNTRWFGRIVSAPAAFVVAAALMLLPATPAFAEVGVYQGSGMLETGSLIQQASADDTRAQLIEQLNDEAVREKLVEMGVDPDRAQERVARLTPEELAQLEARMETDPAGAAGVVGVVAIVFIVMVILDAVGVTDIFSFVGPARER